MYVIFRVSSQKENFFEKNLLTLAVWLMRDVLKEVETYFFLFLVEM